jgi:hypothetical protein
VCWRRSQDLLAIEKCRYNESNFMKTLLRSFLQFTTASVALAVVVNTLLVRFGDKIVDAFYAPGTLGSELVGYGLSLGVYVSIAYALPVLLYRRVLWKWFHPRLCFAGYWKGRVGYAAAVRPSNGDLVSVEPAPPRDLCVEISQDALEIHFGSGTRRDGGELEDSAD